MKTFALVLAAAAMLASPLASASKKMPTSGTKKGSVKRTAPTPRRVSSARPLVLNHDLAGRPFYSTHRVLSLSGN